MVLDTENVAALLRCSAYTVIERAKSGDLPGLHFGDGGWVFPTEALAKRLNELALEESQKRRQPAKPAAVINPVPGRANKRALPVLPDLKSA
jgi:hypothetical protein